MGPNSYSNLETGLKLVLFHFFFLSAGKPTFGRDSQLIFDSLENKNQDKAPPSTTMKLKVPNLVRQFGAEFLGTFLLVLFGDGAIAQVVFGSKESDMGGFLSICFGYGFALMIGILVSGGVSGGHLNPGNNKVVKFTEKINTH